MIILIGHGLHSFIGIPQHRCNGSVKSDLILDNELVQDSIFSDLETYEYVIITPREFVPYFQPLIEYKSIYRKATIVAKEDIIQHSMFWVNGTYGDANNLHRGNDWVLEGKEISQNFSVFNDTAAKIRNFIRYAYDNWDTRYVLLGGDHELMPSRYLFGYIPNWSAGKIVKSIRASIISDQYFAGLNGTWNDDADQHFGEEASFSIADEADFSIEVYIGRAPVNDKHEVTVFVEKVITYETTEKPEHILLHHSYTNPQEIPDTSTVPEQCCQWIPDHYKIWKLYEKHGSITASEWIEAFHQPEKLLIYHVGNGYNDGLYSWYQLSWNNKQRERFTVLDVSKLNNSFPSIHLSISCLTGDFTENECLAEELLLTSPGGPSACFANSEVGCIDRDDATRYSAEFFEQLIKEILYEQTENLGMVLVNTKHRFLQQAKIQRPYRWCFYEINLLGDPETPCLHLREKPENQKELLYVNHKYSPNVNGWNETRFSTIQTAINAAEEFSTIYIEYGTYEEHLTINKTLHLIGLGDTRPILQNKQLFTTSLITLNCHSTHIENLNLNYNGQEESTPTALIHVSAACNGNTIRNNKIQGSPGYGIALNHSIRNHIDNNEISNNTIGIALLSRQQGILPYSLIITCDNIISHNKIMGNTRYGIYIEGSIHNFIRQNVFMNNAANRSAEPSFLNGDLCLIHTKLNVIDHNYWNQPYQEPFQLWSLRGPITLFTFDFSRGIVFQLYQCILIINIGVPYPVYDEHPASTPHNIVD